MYSAVCFGFIRTFSVVSFSGFLLVACATSGGSGANLKAKKFAAEGCIKGGIAGALLGAVIGGDGDDVAKGALFGCAAGAIYSFNIGKRTQKYANAEEAFDSEISRNKENTKQLKAYNQNVAKNIAAYQQQIKKINASKSNQSAKQKSLQTLKKNSSKQLAEAKVASNSVKNELLVAHQQKVTYQPKVSAASNKNWEVEIAALQKEKQVLDKHVRYLSAFNPSI